MRDRPKAEDVKAYRDVAMCSMQDAKRIVFADWRRDCLRDVRNTIGELYTVEQCREVLTDLVDLLIEVEKTR